MTGGLVEAGGAKALDGGTVLAGLGGEVEQDVAAGLAGLLELGEFGGQAGVEVGREDVAVQVEQAARELVPERGVDGGLLEELLDAGAHLFAELVVGKGRSGDAYNGEAGGEAASAFG